MSRKTLNTLLASAVALTLVGAVSSAHAEDTTAPAEKEKCYGVVKAGQNDCAAADGSHSCAASAGVDASGQEWIMLPAGLCTKLVNGSLEPVTAAEVPAADAPAEH